MPIVSIKDTTKTFEVNAGEVIYDALSNRGEELPHGCLSGSCGACRVEILSGADNLSAPGAVEQNTIDAVRDELTVSRGIEFIEPMKIRLSCRAKVIAGDVCIRPIK